MAGGPTRTTGDFGPWLAVSGAHPLVAMELMRHSDLKLPMKIYTDRLDFLNAGGGGVALVWGESAGPAETCRLENG